MIHYDRLNDPVAVSRVHRLNPLATHRLDSPCAVTIPQVGQRRYAKSYRSRRCQEFGLRASTTHVTALDNYLGIRLVEEFYFTDFYRILDRPLTRPPLISDRPAMPKSDSQSPHYLSAARACPCVAFPTYRKSTLS